MLHKIVMQSHSLPFVFSAASNIQAVKDCDFRAGGRGEGMGRWGGVITEGIVSLKSLI